MSGSHRHLTLHQGGSSNSRPSPEFRTAGLDTVRIRFRGVHPDDFQRFRRNKNPQLVQRGEFRSTEGGVTVGHWSDGRAYIEGRVAAILHGKDDHRLLWRGDLMDAGLVGQEIAHAESAEIISVGRADLASELTFPDHVEGRRFLAGLAAVDVPWLKTGTEGGKRSGYETVYWRTVKGRSIVMRAYDKGVESGTAAPGERIRIERQRRWRKTRELPIDVVASADFRSEFVGREFEALISGSTNPVHWTGDVGLAIEELRDRVRARELKAYQAERLAGYLLMQGEGLKRTVRYAREAELRKLGLAVRFADEYAEVFDIVPYLQVAADAFAEAA